MRIATFNVQNMRLRQSDSGPHLDGARDADAPEDIRPGADELDPIDRNLTALVLRDVDADIVALQEVFDLETLDHFHDHYLLPAGAAPYPHRICLPGNDGRGLDVALLSRWPIDDCQSHASLKSADLDIELPQGADADLPIFRRDCLMASMGELTLFVCHFKAPYPDPVAAWPTRRSEALAVRRLIERKFQNPDAARWLVLGDLNEPETPIAGHDRAIAPLIQDFAVDLMQRIPEPDRWTYHDPHSGKYSRPDAFLASPALANDWPDTRPYIVREGLGRETERHRGSRLVGVGTHRPHASDHAALVIDFQGL